MKHSPLSLATLALVGMTLAAQVAAQTTVMPSVLKATPTKAALQPTRKSPAPWCEDDCKTAPNGTALPLQPSKTPSALAAVPVKPAKPLTSQRAATGPGTQTEDDIYVGTKRQVQGVTSPLAATPQVRPGAGTSPNTGATGARKTARSGGDDDLDDLEVERRKVQGVNMPGTTTPQIRPSVGTSPNNGRSVSPGPATPLPK